MIWGKMNNNLTVAILRRTLGGSVRSVIALYAIFISKIFKLIPKRIRSIYQFYYKPDVRSKFGVTYRLTSELIWRRFERLHRGEVLAEDFFSKVKDDDVCWDFGANVGNFSVRFLQRAKYVVAIEANPLNVNDLAYHMRVNSNGKKFKILSGAAGDNSLHVGISVPASGYSGIADTFTNYERPNDIFVPYLPLESFIALERPTIIKIDVDGAEVDILKFLVKHKFLETVKLVYIELQNTTKAECQKYLKKSNFSLLTSDGDNYLFEKHV